MEQKSHLSEVKELNDKGEGVLKFITFDAIDKDGDVTLPGFVGRQAAMLLPGHDWKHIPLGRGESFEDDQAAYFRFKLNMDLQDARDWYSHLRFDQQFGKSLQEVSYGFSVHPEGQEHGQKNGQRVRYLKGRPTGEPGARLYELSFVLVGAGVDTGVVDVKHLHPYPAPRRHLWSGGLPMNSAKDHLSAAVPSVRTARRHVETARRLMGDIPPTAKTKRVNEYLDASLEELDTGVVAIETSVEHWPEPVPESINVPTMYAEPVKAVESTAPVDEGTDSTPPQDAAEKGGQPLQDEAESVIRAIERLTERLEQVKEKRAESSPRYPHGRPMSAERLDQVQALQVRLSRLKTATERTEQEDAAQQELQEMSERLKRLGVTV